MKDKQLKLHSALRSTRKTQVNTIDTLISYVIFLLFLIQVVSFIQNLSNPFDSYIKAAILYKNAEALKGTIIVKEADEDFMNYLCSADFPNTIGTAVNYNIKGLLMPYYDSETEESKIGIHIKRSGNSMNLTFNTNTTSELELVIPIVADIKLSSINTESYDYYNKTWNGKYYEIIIFSNNTDTDTDSFKIELNSTVVILFNTQYANNTDIFAGTTPFNYSCGRARLLPKKSYYSSYALLDDAGAVINYGVDVWWQ